MKKKLKNTFYKIILKQLCESFLIHIKPKQIRSVIVYVADIYESVWIYGQCVYVFVYRCSCLYIVLMFKGIINSELLITYTDVKWQIKNYFCWTF